MHWALSFGLRSSRVLSRTVTTSARVHAKKLYAPPVQATLEAGGGGFAVGLDALITRHIGPAKAEDAYAMLEEMGLEVRIEAAKF